VNRQRSSTTYLAIACLSLFAACSGSTTASPTPVAAAPNSVTLTLGGSVHDNTGRPVPGVTVEVVDSVPAGRATITDDSGVFSLGDVTVTVSETKLRASKDGYATSLTTVGKSGTAFITLWVLTPPAIQPGEYTMSVVADSTCDLPAVARTRTYSATVTLRKYSVNVPPERQTDFDVVLSGASFATRQGIAPTNSLTVHAAGDYLVFYLDAYEVDGFITERLAAGTFVELTGVVAGFIGTSGVSSLPFDGWFTYCEGSSEVIPDPAVQGPLGCGSIDPVYKSCHSKNHRIVLTRR
jgi:hypothetical protein